jgi:hypothetical protein
MRMRTKILSFLTVAVVTAASGVILNATTNSYFDKQYDFATLKTFDFKTQRRISSDPIANNRLWADEIRKDLASSLQQHGFEHANGGTKPDVLVAYYVGLKERYNVQFMDYGYPGFGGPRRFRWGWGWPAGFDVWNIPYTDSTLIVDIIDGQTNQLIWRGYDTNTIDMKKPDKRLDKAVDTLVKKFLHDTKSGT